MHSVVYSYLQGLAARLRALIVVAQMPAHIHEQAQPVLAGDHQPVYGGVPHPGIGVPGYQHAVGKIGSAVQQGVRGDGDLRQVRFRQHYLLRRRVVHHNRRHGVVLQRVHRVRKQPGDVGGGAVKYGRDVVAVPPHSGGQGVIITLHMVKNQRLAALQLRAYAGELVHRVHRSADMRQPPRGLHPGEAISQVLHTLPPVSFSAPAQALKSAGTIPNCIRAFPSTWCTMSWIPCGLL